MSIGMTFDDDYSQALSEYRKARGMSVQEIYKALQQRDRLNLAYCTELEKHLKLRQAVRKIRERIDRTMKDYIRIAADKTNSWEDRQDFRNKVDGLNEALIIIDMILKQEEYKLD